MTNEQKAAAIMADILSRKGLGLTWSEYWKSIDPVTKDAIVDAWTKIIGVAE